MKKQRKQRTAKGKVQAQTVQVLQPDRRKVLRLLRNGTIGVALLASGGVYAVTSVRKTMAEFDLTRIGQGVPVIVQIHDPTCSLCQSLQKQTRKALRRFQDGQIEFLVANIKTSEGQDMAVRYGVGHVTLLFFDAKGHMFHIEEGVQSKDQLETIFRRAFNL